MGPGRVARKSYGPASEQKLSAFPNASTLHRFDMGRAGRLDKRGPPAIWGP